MKKLVIALASIALVSCEPDLPQMKPDLITESTLHDTDDPAIWVNKENTQESIVFGTDKDTDGAIYAFDLEGKVIEEKTLRGMKRPNNVDVEYNVKINDSVTTDILMFTEREREQIRLFSVPDMKPLEQGGFKVFQEKRENEWNLPMGISIFKSPKNDKTYAVVGRKNGPKTNYLHQFELVPAGDHIEFKLVREFGNFSGEKEIEAIAIDEELGFIYYADEKVCVRKYQAEPDAGNEELSCFGAETFNRDIEGIAIATYENGEGYIIVSDQQEHTFNFFDRKTNEFLFAKNLGTTETDGCEVFTGYLNEQFPNGLFVAMNDNKNFYFYDLSKIVETK